jgi:hypothetical protein
MVHPCAAGTLAWHGCCTVGATVSRNQLRTDTTNACSHTSTNRRMVPTPAQTQAGALTVCASKMLYGTGTAWLSPLAGNRTRHATRPQHNKEPLPAPERHNAAYRCAHKQISHLNHCQRLAQSTTWSQVASTESAILLKPHPMLLHACQCYRYYHTGPGLA